MPRSVFTVTLGRACWNPSTKRSWHAALERRGFRVERQRSVRFEYDGMVFEEGLRVDLVVDDRVIVEVKSVERLARAHPKQLLTYLKLTNRQVGLLITFGAPTLREGLRRIVNGFPSSAPSRLRVNQVVVDRAMRQRY